MKPTLLALAAFIYIVEFTDVTNAGILIPRRGVLTQRRRSWEDVENVKSTEEHSDSHETHSKEGEIPDDTTLNSKEEDNKDENEELIPKDRDERNVGEEDVDLAVDEALFDKETQEERHISSRSQEGDGGTSGEEDLVLVDPELQTETH